MILQARDIPILREFKDELGQTYLALAYDKKEDDLLVMDVAGEHVHLCGSHSVELIPCKHQYDFVPVGENLRIKVCKLCGIKELTEEKPEVEEPKQKACKHGLFTCNACCWRNGFSFLNKLCKHGLFFCRVCRWRNGFPEDESHEQ